ncbi:PAS domain-containing sensor histidine kinase [Natronorubrum sp. FCH18a]|uniref:PAS domain-containing sensor histidine kinase n=1 Tax=Natronorubrum sp. FCH18a TaxID=3447018 RepID=UPI003F514568
MSRRADETESAFWADTADDTVAARRYRTLVNAVDDGIYQLDAAGRFVAVNDHLLEITGYAREDLLGEHASSVLADDDFDRITTRVDESVTNGDRPNETVELTVRTAGGETCSCEVRASPLVDDGTVRGSVGVVREFDDSNRTARRLEERDRQLARTQRRFEAIFNDPNILVGLLEPDGTVLDINGTAMEYIDADLEDVTGEPFWETPWWGEDETVQPNVKEWTERAAAGEYVEFEADLTRPNGDQYTLSGVFRPVTNDDGEVVSIIVSDRDITERKRRERSLRDAKAQLEAATEAGAVGTWEWQIPENQMTVGTLFARKFGIDPDEARSGVPLERFIDSIHEDDRDRVVTQIENVVESGDEYEAEYRVWNADDELRWVIARGHVEYDDDDGTPVTFPGALTDITDRKRAEIEVKAHRRQLETLFQVLPVGAVVADADGSLIRANATAKEIWGGNVFDAESVAEYEKYSAVWAESGESVGPEDWTMSQVLQGEAVTDPNIYEISTFDDERRIIMEHGMPVRDEHGEVSRAVVTLTDITERRESQRKLEETVAKLEESNERLEQFAYAASHDLQEPLRMVTSYLQLLEDRYGDAFDEDGEEFLEFAVDGAERMHDMIDALLEYSRIETQGDSFEPVELDGVVDDVIDDLQLQIEETAAEITVDELPVVDGDASQLRQVFQNLLDNALTYHGDDPPRVHVDVDRRGEMWLLSVWDDGIGIDPDDQERVFSVFDRLHSRDEYDGTGIGLALCQRIVERHGGDIWVQSESGEGATFAFTLPDATE